MKIIAPDLLPPRTAVLFFGALSVVAALLIGGVLLLAYLRGGVVSRNGSKDRARRLREGFAADDDEMRVLHIAPSSFSAPLVVEHDPSRVALAPDALKPLERYSDAGIRVAAVGDSDRRGRGGRGAGGGHVVRTSDAMRLYMGLKYENEDDDNDDPGRKEREPPSFSVLSTLVDAFRRRRRRQTFAPTPTSSVLAVLPSPENDQHFVVLGNWASLSPTTSDDSDNEENEESSGSDEQHTHTIVQLFRALRRQQRSRGEHAVDFVCRDEADVHMLTVVLASVVSGNDDDVSDETGGGGGAYFAPRDRRHQPPHARTIVDRMVRPHLRFVDSLEALGASLTSDSGGNVDGKNDDSKGRRRRGGAAVVVFSFVGAHAPLWHQLRGARVVWYSYADGGSLNLTLAKHYLPFLTLANVDVSAKTNEMQETRGDRRVYGLLTVPALMMLSVVRPQRRTREEEHEHPMLLTAAIALVHSDDGDAIRTQNNATNNNLFAMWFPFCEATRKVLARFNAAVYARRLNSGTDGSEFYTHGLPLEVVTGDRGRGLNVGRPRLSILEQFAEQPPSPPPPPRREGKEEGGGGYDNNDDDDGSSKLLTIDVFEPSAVRGFVDHIHDGRVRRARIASPSSSSPEDAPAFVRGVPVHVWDRIRLKNQAPGLLNGLFYVAAVHPHAKDDRGSVALMSTIELHDAVVLRIDASKGDVVDLDGTYEKNGDNSRGGIATVDVSLGAPRSPRLARRLRELGASDRVYFVDLDAEATPVSGGGSSSSRRFVLNPEDVERIKRGKAATEDDEAWEDDAYACLSDVTVKNPARCRELGGGRGVWDRPCRRDVECPFFQANRRYPNYRGGCEGSGACEMPLGVRRVGYRFYDPVASRPLCHSCADPLDAECCSQQQPHPDYAFPLDEMQRRRYGMS